MWIILVILGWIVCGATAAWLVRRDFMNEFGWNERTLDNCSEPLLQAVVFMAGPLGLLPALFCVLMNRFRCFMTKNKALAHYDAKDMKKHSYYIGREIAKDEGRL